MTKRFNKDFKIFEYDGKFGGYYPTDIDPNDSKNRKYKLSGTTTIVGTILVPFGDMISPAFSFWMDKMSRKEQNDQEGYFANQNKFDEAIKGITQAELIAKEALDILVENGNDAEQLFYEKLLAHFDADLFIADSGIKNEKAEHFADLCLKQILKLGKEIKVISYQEGISDSELQDIGFFDFVLEIDGLIYLVDMKTGKRVKDHKLQAVKYQLLGSYKPKWEGFYNKKLDKVIVLSGVDDEIKVGTIKMWKTFAEIIDITDADPENNLQKEYEMAAKLRKMQLQSGNLKNMKKEIAVVL